MIFLPSSRKHVHQDNDVRTTNFITKCTICPKCIAKRSIEQCILPSVTYKSIFESPFVRKRRNGVHDWKDPLEASRNSKILAYLGNAAPDSCSFPVLLDCL